MRLLEENPEEDWVDYISVGGWDAVVLSHVGKDYRRWSRPAGRRCTRRRPWPTRRSPRR